MGCPRPLSVLLVIVSVVAAALAFPVGAAAVQYTYGESTVTASLEPGETVSSLGYQLLLRPGGDPWIDSANFTQDPDPGIFPYTLDAAAESWEVLAVRLNCVSDADPSESVSAWVINPGWVPMVDGSIPATVALEPETISALASAIATSSAPGTVTVGGIGSWDSGALDAALASVTFVLGVGTCALAFRLRRGV